MRWERLFEELDARFDAEASLQRDAEIADRTRRERALIPLYSRLLANVGRATISVRLPGAQGPRVIVGAPRDVGPDWLLLVDTAQQTHLVPLAAVRGITGLRPGAQEGSLVGRRFTLGAALRGISRDRAVVDLADLDGQVLTGTIDAVGADHLDLAEHAPDEPRRARHVVRTHVIPIAALGSVRRR
ncbi:hypothetical protein [Intrasporangium sp.]|jgi:hypothetical protein|uniref:hypothetical protein n=1 Tax=Intrasporangium sp. TaxID=1925024 RepID=UPI0033655308